MSIFLPNYNLYMIKDNSYYKLKYLKYKSKYINYKNLIGGLINEPVLESKAVTILSKPSKPLPLTPQEQQQIELTFREMYPTIDIARAKMIKLPLLKNTPESIKVKVIKFFIFVDMEFTILPYYELQPIIEHIKNNTLFTGDPPTLDKDVKTILENYLKNYYIPKLFINMLKGSKDVNEPIDYISFSSVSISTSYSSLFNDIIKKISEGLLILHIVSGFSDKELHNYSVKYIIDNDRLFKILVESITDDKDVNNGTKILRLFINCIKSSDINVISKKNIIDKINELLIKLHNEYVETTRCNPLFHRLSESSYPKECYKLRNAHKLSDKVNKLLKQYEKKVEEVNKKKDLSEQKYKELQLLYKDKLEELKNRLDNLKSSYDYSTIIKDFERVINDAIKQFDNLKRICKPKIDGKTTTQQLELYQNDAKSQEDPQEKYDSLSNYYGVFKGIDVDTPENICRNITIYNRFLSIALLYLEEFLQDITGSIEEKYNKKMRVLLTSFTKFIEDQKAVLKREIHDLIEKRKIEEEKLKEKYDEDIKKIEIKKLEEEKLQKKKYIEDIKKIEEEKLQKEKLKEKLQKELKVDTSNLPIILSDLKSKYIEKDIPIIPSQSQTVS